MHLDQFNHQQLLDFVYALRSLSLQAFLHSTYSFQAFYGRASHQVIHNLIPSITFIDLFLYIYAIINLLSFFSLTFLRAFELIRILLYGLLTK